ncbi:MAG: adenine deaminase [Archaeoglobaceae archaeon]|nr:adenine deaminase [Archaeoglobaceae archaeon]MDK2875910.1 adenine deaminase [Archaeoglobaceae archaeon]
MRSSEKLSKNELKRLIRVAKGEEKADLVIKSAEVANVLTEEIYTADIAICGNRIAGIGSYEGIAELDAKGLYAVPGLIDAHTHVEMSLLTLSEFARLVVPRGNTCIVADPHEIANVLGKKGVLYLLEESKHVPIRFYCLVPSCVPSSPLETSGGIITAEDVEELLEFDQVIGLAELMNYPGLLNCDDEIIEKICKAELVDGHCPALSGKALNAYVSAGIGSDHESTRFEEAKEKLRLGMWIMVREGSAAKNLRNLKPILESRHAMLVTDGDRSVFDLLTEGYLDSVVRRAFEEGVDEFRVLQAVTLNPAEYFGLNSGLIAPGRFADIVLLSDLRRFEVKKVIVDGKEPVFGKYNYPEDAKRTMKARKITENDLFLPAGFARIIEIIEGEIITGESIEEVKGIDTARDILKAVVVERHKGGKNIGKAYVRGFGLKRGAIAQSIAHDAHNIVAVGADDAPICNAVNRLIDIGGGIIVYDGDFYELRLRIAGIMSDESAEEVAKRLKAIEKKLRELGCKLRSPIITLSFIALPVIPKLKLTDLGLIDVEKFRVVDPMIK